MDLWGLINLTVVGLQVIIINAEYQILGATYDFVSQYNTMKEENIANRYGRDIKPSESPAEHNAIFDTRQGGHRADLSNIASEKSPSNIQEFLESFFTRDTFINNTGGNKIKNK